MRTGSFEYVTDGVGFTLVWRDPDDLIFLVSDEVHEGSLTTWYRWRSTLMARTLVGCEDDGGGG